MVLHTNPPPRTLSQNESRQGNRSAERTRGNPSPSRALANHRLTHLPDGLVRIALKKKFADGTVAVEMDPLSLLTRLAASVPPPRMHTVRYAGVLASRSRFRSRIVRRQRVATGDEKPTPRRRHIPYAELMQRTFRIDVETCTDCGGKMKLIALVKDPSSITHFLRHLRLPTEAPARAPPRDEPYWQSVVLGPKRSPIPHENYPTQPRTRL